jgi:hypothetical protein
VRDFQENFPGERAIPVPRGQNSSLSHKCPREVGFLQPVLGLAIATVAIPADLIGERLAKNASESTPNVANRAEFVQVTVALPGGVSATTKESLS